MKGRRTWVFLPAVIMLALVLAGSGGIRTEGAPTRVEPNDTLEEATDLYFDTNPVSDSLDSVDTDDWYKILDLVGDNGNDQLDAQRYSIGLKRTSGSNVKGVLMEPNGLRMGEIYSDGQIEELEFIVPRDGDYYLWITADPKGTSSSYEIYQGGAFDIDNREFHDKNNEPPGTGFSNSVDVANSLNPTKDLVDYFHMIVPPQRSLEATLTFLGDLTFKLQVLNDTFFKYTEVGTDDPFILANDGVDPINVVLRVYVHVSTEGGYPSSTKSYNLGLVLWSHVSIPIVNQSDPWSMVRTNEDIPLPENINLTKHFKEPNGDNLEFELINDPSFLDIQFHYTINLAKEVLAVEVSVMPHPNWHGEEALIFKASDRDGNTTDDIIVNVSSVNDLPYVQRIGNAEYESGTFNMFAYEDVVKHYNITYDDEDDPLERIFFTSNETYQFLEVNPDNGTITIDAVQEDVGNYWFNLQMSDTHDTVVIDLNLDIQHVNDAPPEPSIEFIGVNVQGILPGEEVFVEAVVGPDIDGDILTFTWDWGDGETSDGRTSSHIYGEGIYGNRTVVLTVSDGRLESSASVRIFLERPEDLANGDLFRTYSEEQGDVVKFEESWRVNDPDMEKKFQTSKIENIGVDLTSLTCQRRGNNLEVVLKVKDSIQIDGSFQYYLYVLKPGYQEPYVDFQNLTDWDSIPDRSPAGVDVIAYREYVGDPILHNTSTGIIMNQDSLVWTIPFSELVDGGMEFPIDLANFSLFAYSLHFLDYGESKGIVERYIMSDTAGAGALKVGPIKTGGDSGGGGGTNLADIATPMNIGLIITLVVLIIIVGVASFYFTRRQAKEKKKEEQEFIDHVKKMRDEGKDLFGKEVEEEGSKDVSYEELYGAPAPEGHDVKGSEIPSDNLPGAGLGQPINMESHIMEFQVGVDPDGNIDEE